MPARAKPIRHEGWLDHEHLNPDVVEVLTPALERYQFELKRYDRITWVASLLPYTVEPHEVETFGEALHMQTLKPESMDITAQRSGMGYVIGMKRLAHVYECARAEGLDAFVATHLGFDAQGTITYLAEQVHAGSNMIHPRFADLPRHDRGISEIDDEDHLSRYLATKGSRVIARRSLTGTITMRAEHPQLTTVVSKEATNFTDAFYEVVEGMKVMCLPENILVPPWDNN